MTQVSLNPKAMLPKERVGQVGEHDTEMLFLISEEFRSEQEEIRSLLGPDASSMSFAQLLSALAKLSV